MSQEQTILETVIEVLNQGVSLLDEELLPEVDKTLSLIDEAYIPVSWPDNQEYMQYDWFRDECILDTTSLIGDSVYLIPLKRLLEIK